MKIRLHVVVDKEDDAIVELVQNALNEICSKMSYSPSRLQPSLSGCMKLTSFYQNLTMIGMEKKMIVKLIALIRQCFIQMSTTYNSNLSRTYYD